MRKMRNRRGFTMAELLIVVAIIGVLSAVTFVGVTQQERALNRVERDAAAREIFIAAQNHLTMAESQGYLGITETASKEFGTQESAGSNVYYLIYPTNETYSITPTNMLDLMLPFGAVDETVRTGGSYIIRYDRKNAIVMDVFYCSTNDKKFKHTLDKSDYTTLSAEFSKEPGNRSYESAVYRNNYSGAVLGWYGGAAAQSLNVAAPLYEPVISIINDETLRVVVNDDERNAASLKLIITGKTSGAMKSFTLKTAISDTNRVKLEGTTYTITLDDITTPGMHFADLQSENSIQFIPGEDISVQAIAYDNTQLTNIAYSAELTTNSLFEKTTTETSGERTAYINNFRHLENLYGDISKVNIPIEGMTDLKIFNAIQTTDLSWKDFSEKIDPSGKIKVYKISDNMLLTGDDYFIPISPDYSLNYSGYYNDTVHSITGVETVTTSGEAGLFGKNGTNCSLTVENLQLIDFNIKGTGDTGALAGKLNAGSDVTNVLVYNSAEYESARHYANIASTGGNVGGLIGSITGGTVSESAAAVYVSGGSNTGGLIGLASDATIKASYSGGHTLEGRYSDNTVAADAAAKGLVNVIGGSGSSVGGLIGSISGTTIQYSYSTCSVYGEKAGGLIGTGTGSNIVKDKCYAAGLVQSSLTNGARTFIGIGSLGSGSGNCFYVAGINASTMPSGDDTNTIIKAFGANGATAISNASNPEEAKASPYDTTTYSGIYSFMTVGQLGYTSTPPDGVTPSKLLSWHYGDWQMPAVDLALTIDNSEYLTAKVDIPIAQIDTYATNWDEKFNLYMLVKGVISGEEAFLRFSLTGTNPTYALAMELTSLVDGRFTEESTQADFDAWKAASNAILAAPVTGDLNVHFSIDLDRITSPTGHFKQLFPEFIPGEDLIVAVDGGISRENKDEIPILEKLIIPDNRDKWSVGEAPNIRSVVAETNSLFADPKYNDSLKTSPAEYSEVGSGIAAIGNIRHLENLDGLISGLNTSALNITTAKQIVDLSEIPAQGENPAQNLSWPGFISEVKTRTGVTATPGIKVFKLDDTTTTPDDLFLPVSPAYPLIYDGQSHTITGIKVETAGDAGLFGALIENSGVSNLELIDFSVTSTTGSAGALAGTLTSATVTNVLARNSTAATTPNITTTSGSAGGLIGTMDSATISRSAAALIVSSSSGNAGGLIGTTSGGTVEACYSGGHTTDGKYTGTVTGTTPSNFNVTATAGTAGGLIGNAGSTAISHSYSTCSAYGATAGGLVGTASGSIKNCYATGLVDGTTKGAFAGALQTAATGCNYFEIINEDATAVDGYLPAVPGTVPDGTVITALDASADSYNTFVGAPDSWSPAVPYDTILRTTYYSVGDLSKYNLKTVSQLGATGVIEEKKDADGNVTVVGDFVATHYGDWPAPEIFVMNPA